MARTFDAMERARRSAAALATEFPTGTFRISAWGWGVVMLVLGLGVSSIATVISYRLEQEWVAENLNSHVAASVAELDASIARRTGVLRTIATLLEVSASPEPRRYGRLARDVFRDYPDFRAILFAPEVPAPARMAYGVLAERQGYPAPSWDPAAGPVSYPVLHGVPSLVATPWVNQDLALLPGFQGARDRFSDENRLSSLAPVNIIDADGRTLPSAILIMHALDAPPEVRLLSNRAILGGLFDLRALLSGVLGPLATLGVDIAVVSEHREATALYSHSAGRTQPDPVSVAAISELRAESGHVEAAVDVGGEAWRILFRPTDAYLDAQQRFDPFWILWSGAALSALLAFTLLVVLRRAEERTRLSEEIASANNELQTEIQVRQMAERAAQDNERRVRAFASAASDWFWEMDRGLRYSYVSERYCHVMRVAISDVVGKTHWQLAEVNPHDPEWQLHLETLEARLPFRDFEYVVLDSGGLQRTLRISGVPMFDERGDFQGYRGTGSDVTALKRHQRELVEKRQLLEAALANVMQGIAMFDHDRRLLIWNERFVQLMAAEDWVTEGAPFADLLSAVGGDGLVGGRRQWHGVQRQIFAKLSQAQAWSGEIALQRGTTAEIHVSPMADGGFVATVTDITERRQNEEEIRSLARFPAENPAPILRVDVNGRLLYANEPSTPLLEAWDVAEQGTVGDELTNLVRASLEEGASREEELEEGGAVYSLLISPVEEDGFAHVYGRDVTARRRAEEELVVAKQRAEAANAAKSSFLATVSHEIRTPLNGILGMTELLHQTRLTERQRNYGQTIRESGEMLLTVINDILDFSKLEAGKFQLAAAAFDLGQVMESVVDLLRGRAKQRGIDLVLLVPPDLPRQVVADAARLRQVLLNLAGNGIKFTAEGGVALSASMVSRTRDEALIRFEVSDSGIGIEDDVREKLFSEFMQADASIARQYGGTGLGLAICKRLVDLMGGEIGLESVPDVGSRFWFTVPVRLEERQPPPLPPLLDHTIVVISASTFWREAVASQIKGWGLTVIVADRADEAWRLLEAWEEPKKPIVLVSDDLKDLRPAMLAQELRQLAVMDGAALYLMADGTDEAAAGQALQAGFDEVIDKPFVESRVYPALAAVLGEAPPDGWFDYYTEKYTDQSGTTRLKILAAEDNMVNRMLLIDLLEQAGHSIQVVENGAQAVEAVSGDQFDLVLMDMQMPVVDGLEATRRIRELGGAARAVPVIALTANVQEEDRQRCFAAGMNDFLEKPINFERLQEMVSRYGQKLSVAPARLPARPRRLQSPKRKDRPHRGPALEETTARAHVVPTAVVGQPAPVSRVAAPVLDVSVLDGLARMLGRDKVLFYVRNFTTDAVCINAEISEAAAGGDMTKLQASAHKLKGVAGSVGIMAVAARAETIDGACKKNQPEAALVEIPDLARDLDGAIDALRVAYPDAFD